MCPERALLWTESFQRTEGQPRVKRNAKTLYHLLANMTIFIRDDELTAGKRTAHGCEVNTDKT